MEQIIPARHGVATFVPAGRVIKIVNTSGTQVVDTWAFALPKPEAKLGEVAEAKQEDNAEETGQSTLKAKEQAQEPVTPAATPKKGKKKTELPSQEEAEKATSQAAVPEKSKTAQKSTWSSYVPTLPSWSSKKDSPKDGKEATQRQKDSSTWASYFPTGKGFSAYIPKSASDTISGFASSHYRDPNKSVLEQLQDFSKTPVGAAGLAAVSGSGYGGSLYAGYQAYQNVPSEVPPMEFLSMPHSRAATLHLRPQTNDTLVSNLRESILTLVEDSSPGIHDTLMAACDPQRYRGLGVENWHEHGSCAENLVLALKELNDRAGLKGAKAVGADVTINSVPAPLHLFMNVPWAEGELSFDKPEGKEGDFVRFRAERDVVVVMSACPQDVLDINAKKPTDAHFIVEEDPEEAQKKQGRRRSQPRKLSSYRAPSTVATGDLGDDDKSRTGSNPPKKATPRKTTRRTLSAQEGPTAVEKTTSPPAEQAKPSEDAVEKPEQQASSSPAPKKKPRKLNAKPKPTG
ncbi:hypothetical protein AMS68_004068 [Peltaster fructicola]|uniref:DUF1989 domain-containing protein n=1 Tax=Peltaster fructicola TaxID=286661 RepID=A0A6H0XV69_9PEZI|nr:hypothetical protein AMS68_004068 [Peltaster fructicola]